MHEFHYAVLNHFEFWGCRAYILHENNYNEAETFSTPFLNDAHIKKEKILLNPTDSFYFL